MSASKGKDQANKATDTSSLVSSEVLNAKSEYKEIEIPIRVLVPNRFENIKFKVHNFDTKYSCACDKPLNQCKCLLGFVDANFSGTITLEEEILVD